MFAFLFIYAIFFGLSILLRPKPKLENARPAGLGDFQIVTATEGRAVPLAWGTVRIDGANIVWYGRLKAVPIKKKVSTGLFSSTKQTIGFKYYLGLQFAWCRGTIDYLKRVWVNEKEIYRGAAGDDVTVHLNAPDALGGEQGSGGIIGPLHVYAGSATQQPNVFIHDGTPDYLWFDDYGLGNDGQPLGDYGSHQYYESTITGGGSYGPTGTTGGEINIGRGTNTVCHVIGNLTPGSSPGDLNYYTGVLKHSDRPRLSDNIKAQMEFIAKQAGQTDFAANAGFWLGVKVKDEGDFTSEDGVYVIIGNNTKIDMYVVEGGTPHHIADLGAPLDFPDMTDLRHTVDLRVDGNDVVLRLDGAIIHSSTEATIASISTSTNKGFLLGVNGNLNSDFPTSVDNSDVGIYSLLIDSTTRTNITDQPAYRGTAHGVFEGGYIGNAADLRPWAFEIVRLPNNLAMPDGKYIVNEADANPAEVLYEILTDPDWGLGFTSSNIDLDNFRTAGATLWEEGNGWSFLLDNPIECQDLIKEVERQIDGTLYLDRETGVFKIKLIRADYTAGDLLTFNEANILEIRNFSRQAWHETTNNIHVQFLDRAKDYKETYALAQDGANIALQGNTIVSSTEQYPGVKHRTLANKIAWRDLRHLAYPIAKAEIVVDRSAYVLNQGDAVRISDSRLSLVEMVFRVVKVDLGKLEDNQIILTLVQDVFYYDTASFSDPPDSGAEPPVPPAEDPETGDRLIFEAPRAYNTRAGEGIGTPVAGSPGRIFVGVVNAEQPAATFAVWDNPLTTAYVLDEDNVAYNVAGKLDAALTIDQADGTSITLVPDPSSHDDLLNALDTVTADQIGSDLLNVVLVDDEFIGTQSIANDGGNVKLVQVFRGLMDTVPAHHAEGARVWLATAGGHLTNSRFNPAYVATIKPVPTGLTIADVAATNVTMVDRTHRPYPPTKLSVTGGLWADTVSLDTDVVLTFIRRDFRTANEVDSLTEAELPGDFPATYDTKYKAEVYNDADVLIFTTAFTAGTDTITITPVSILLGNAAVVPTDLNFKVLTQHTFDAADLLALQKLTWRSDVISELSDAEEMGLMPYHVAGTSYTALTTGTYELDISAALTQNVEVQVNGGGWAPLILAGGTDQAFSVTSGDVLEFRHDVNSVTGAAVIAKLLDDSAVIVAWGLFTY